MLVRFGVDYRKRLKLLRETSQGILMILQVNIIPDFKSNHSLSFYAAAAMKEMWEHKVERIRQTSPYGHLPNWSENLKILCDSLSLSLSQSYWLP